MTTNDVSADIMTLTLALVALVNQSEVMSEEITLYKDSVQGSYEPSPVMVPRDARLQADQCDVSSVEFRRTIGYNAGGEPFFNHSVVIEDHKAGEMPWTVAFGRGDSEQEALKAAIVAAKVADRDLRVELAQAKAAAESAWEARHASETSH